MPRFNKAFCRAFARSWTEKGLDESLADFALDFNGRQIVRDNMSALKRNVSLMNLTRYRHPENHFHIEYEDQITDPSLIDYYQLNKFRRFLAYREAIPTI